MMTDKNIADYLFERRATALPPRGLAEVFDRLVWCMDDNGAEIDEATSRWLSGDDLDRVAVALSRQESFPYESREEMLREFARITWKWPQFEARCNEIVAAWDATFRHLHK